MLNAYYQFNLIFKHKNVKLKNLFRIRLKANTIWFSIILNSIVNSTISSIFGVQLSNMLDFGVSIHSMIFENAFHWPLKVSQITLVWPIIIDVVAKWSFIGRALLMVQPLGRLVQRIKNQQTRKRIVEKG